MISFEGIDQPHQSFEEEMRTSLKEKLNELRARRRGVNIKIEKKMDELEDLEQERLVICRKEDAVADTIERRKATHG